MTRIDIPMPKKGNPFMLDMPKLDYLCAKQRITFGSLARTIVAMSTKLAVVDMVDSLRMVLAELDDNIRNFDELKPCIKEAEERRKLMTAKNDAMQRRISVDNFCACLRMAALDWFGRDAFDGGF